MILTHSAPKGAQTLCLSAFGGLSAFERPKPDRRNRTTGVPAAARGQGDNKSGLLVRQVALSEFCEQTRSGYNIRRQRRLRNGFGPGHSSS
jgi:hypothetical protein